MEPPSACDPMRAMIFRAKQDTSILSLKIHLLYRPL